MSETQSLYYIICLRHSSNQDYAVQWWGPKKAGYTPNLDNAGKYKMEELAGHSREECPNDFYIPCEDIDKIAVEREYNYDGWKEGRFVILDELFLNTYDIPKSRFYKAPKGASDKRYFRYVMSSKQEAPK
jgi:hypothetical protein